jgi:endothelin-converting enzyme
LFSFNVEGDAGGEDSQVQSLWFYQTSGGLPSKEYYEEKPILDLYKSVVTDVLVDIVSHVKGSKEVEKRDIISDIIAEAVEVEQNGWPWPWPGDDKPKPPPGDDSPDNKTKEEPLETRMERLAVKVVDFERELIRAGTDPEYVMNPHYAYNPYPTEKVDKHLPIIDVRSYISTFNPRSFPVNITVTYPPYLKSVSKLVADTPDYVLSGYFATRLAFSYSSALGPKVATKQATKRLADALKGIKKGTEENRQDTCLSAVDGIVGYIGGGEYVKKVFSPEAKEDGTKIINGQLDCL